MQTNNSMEPDAVASRKRVLAKSIWLTVPGTYIVIAAAYAVTPPMSGLLEPAARLVLAARWLLVAALPYAAVCLVILYQRFAEGAHNPLAHVESERLKVHCRVMQNNLEQLALFAACIVPLATYLSSDQARLIPITCVFFAAARLLYWWGYLRNGTLGRAPGVQLTFTLNVSLLAAAIAMFARGITA